MILGPVTQDRALRRRLGKLPRFTATCPRRPGMQFVCFRILSCLFLLLFFFFRKKGKKKKSQTHSCSHSGLQCPPPLTGIQGEFGKNARRAGKQRCDSRPGVSSLFQWLKLGCRSRVSLFLTYAGLWRKQRSEKPERRRTMKFLGEFQMQKMQNQGRDSCSGYRKHRRLHAQGRC